MSVIHLLPDSKFADDLITCIDTYSQKSEKHSYYIKGSNKLKYILNNNHKVSLMGDQLPSLLQSLNTNDELIIHNLDNKTSKEILNHKKKYKLGWVFWGTEFYNEAGIEMELLLPMTKKKEPTTFILTKNPALSVLPFFQFLDSIYYKYFKKKKQNRIKAKIFALVDNIYHFNTFDIALVKKYFPKFNANHIPFVYPSFFSNPNYKQQAHPFKISDKHLNLLIGHSASSVINHYDVIDSVGKLPNIHMWIPLSYGDNRYSKNLKKYLGKNYPDKFTIIDKFMDSGTYFSFLNELDGGIFGSLRSIGLGNLNTLLFLGKSVFLFDKNPAFKYFISLGFSIGEIEKIDSEKYLKEQINNSENNNKNKTIAKQMFDGNTTAINYREIF